MKRIMIVGAVTAGLLLTGCSADNEHLLRDSYGKLESTERGEHLTEEGEVPGDKAYMIPEDASLDRKESEVLRVPGGEVKVIATGKIPEVADHRQGWNNPRQSAPEGKYFFAAEIHGYTDVVQVKVGDEKLDLPGSRFAVVATDDTPILLVATVDGVEQSLDLRTGDRLTTNIAIDWYSPVTLSPDTRDFGTTVSTPSGNAHWEGVVKDVSVDPWLPGYGWADSGRGSWLSVIVAPGQWRTDDVTYEVTAPKGRISLRDDQGNTYSLKQLNVITQPGDQTLVFEIPAGGGGYELFFETSGLYSNFAGDVHQVQGEVVVPIN